mmetsp:Transcript_60756/g.174203  ORF Transcript_60756/g.174203 Transcript_60756/m.174203 type:complete len:238 (+) Transcript_60756:435-1148(+)
MLSRTGAVELLDRRRRRSCAACAIGLSYRAAATNVALLQDVRVRLQTRVLVGLVDVVSHPEHASLAGRRLIAQHADLLAGMRQRRRRCRRGGVDDTAAGGMGRAAGAHWATLRNRFLPQPAGVWVPQKVQNRRLLDGVDASGMQPFDHALACARVRRGRQRRRRCHRGSRRGRCHRDGRGRRLRRSLRRRRGRSRRGRLRRGRLRRGRSRGRRLLCRRRRPRRCGGPRGGLRRGPPD